MNDMNRRKNPNIYRLCCSYIFPMLLLLYPLRHINMGLDLADTGYNYANFRYGLEHMDSMWFFSTYLANAAGHFLTLLPGGHTLLFMNLYTGLFVSALALISYRFLTKRMGLPAILAFVGECVAISLCWCPTALLYNYMTYLLFLAGVLLIYEGLTQEKNVYLALAGAALGCNVFVRFSNLPEAGMIAAVWAYGVICRKSIKKVLKETVYCISGYLGAVFFWLGFIDLHYGLTGYVEGIKRLFAMTENATDYKASSMLFGMFNDYIQNLYWMNRILVFMLPGLAACMVLPKEWKRISKAVCVFFSAAAAVWLYGRNFCDLHFDKDGAIYTPGVLFLILALFVCTLCILSTKKEKNEKLLAGMIILALLITPLGSNNRLLTGINNLFFAVPYVLWSIYRLCRKDDIRLFAVKAMAVMFLSLFLFQSIGFGVKFVFTESEGAGGTEAKVENNDVLKGVCMSRERAGQMEELSAYVSDRGLAGKEAILYGEIPSLSFYLEMPSAFNPWSDLESYSMASMSEAVDKLKRDLTEGAELPIVILNRELMADIGENAVEDEKLALICDFMEEYGYMEAFSNDKFILYEAGR